MVLVGGERLKTDFQKAKVTEGNAIQSAKKHIFGTQNLLCPGKLGVCHQKINKKLIPVIN